MPPELDVYRDWLGIAEAVRPLNYYQLLRLKLFEDDAATIRERYRQAHAQARQYAGGDYTRRSQELLNELAKAMLCLTDAQRKREYDASLGRQQTAAGSPRTLEEILLARKIISAEQLQSARGYAQAIGIEVRDALVQKRFAAAEVVMLAYAEAVGLPYVELAEVGVDAALAPQVPPPLARHHSCVPVMFDEGQLLVASPNPLTPEVEEELRLRFGAPVRTVLCTAASVNAAVTRHYPRDAALPPPGKLATVKTPGAKAAPGTKIATADPVASTDTKPDRNPQNPTAKEIRPVNDEQIKRYTMFALIATSVVVMLYVLISWLTFHPSVEKLPNGQQVFHDFDGIWTAIKGVFFGAIVGAGVFFAAMKLNL